MYVSLSLSVVYFQLFVKNELHTANGDFQTKEIFHVSCFHFENAVSVASEFPIKSNTFTRISRFPTLYSVRLLRIFSFISSFLFLPSSFNLHALSPSLVPSPCEYISKCITLYSLSQKEK